MKNFKSSLLGFSMVVAAGAYLYASDTVEPQTGVVRSYSPNRWAVTKVGAEANSGSLGTTNVVQAAAGSVGKIVFVPGAVTDVLKVYNSTTGAGSTASTLIFEAAVGNSPTMANSSTTALGVPVVYDLLPGWSATSGITTIITRSGNTATSSKAYISYDKNR